MLHINLQETGNEISSQTYGVVVTIKDLHS